MKKTDSEPESPELIPGFDREPDEEPGQAKQRAKENEIEAELDYESGRRPTIKPEQPW